MLVKSVSLCLMVVLLSLGCASVDQRKLDRIQYYGSVEEAPPYTVIAIYDALGHLSLLDLFKPTFEKAIVESKIEAVRRKGDAIIFLQQVKAADLPVDSDIDIVSVFLRGTGFLAGSNSAFKTANAWDKIEKVDCQEQPAWLFKIVKLNQPQNF